MEAQLLHPQTTLLGSCFCALRVAQSASCPSPGPNHTLSLTLKASTGKRQVNGLKNEVLLPVVFYIPVNVL